MAINYTLLAQKAQALIEANGRPCTFSRVGQAPANADQPWRAPTTTAGVGGPVSYPGVVAVVTQEEYGDQPANGVSRPMKMVVLVAAASFPAGAVDLKTLDHVDDGQTVWKILKMLPIMPGDTEIIYQSDLAG